MRAAATHPEPFPEPRLRPLTGAMELALAEAVTCGASRPARVTVLLSAGLERLGELPMTPDLARRLASGTREWLLQQLASCFRPTEDWFEAACEHCGERYDLGFSLRQLQPKPAGAGFPVVAVETSRGLRRFEVPSGLVEEKLAAAGEGGDAARRLILALTGLDDDAPDFARTASPDDLDRIDAAIEEIAPEAADCTRAACPTCEAATMARLEPLGFAFPREGELLGEIHLMAAGYHWTEAQILALPTARRQRYLELIRAERRAGGWR